MKMRIGFVFLTVWLGLSLAALAQSTTNESVPALQAQLAAHVNQAQFAEAQWGVKVVNLTSGHTVFEHNADKLMKPASNAKMYTASLALDRLGPDFRIKTSLYASAKPDASGAVHGDLILFGRGDPSFAARFNDGDYNKSLEPVYAAFAAAGIKSIEGDLIGDESYFHGPPYGTDWTWDDLQQYYGAPVSALTVEDNNIDLVFKPGQKEGDPSVIVTKPETTILAFSNRTHTVAAGQRGHIDMYRPVGESVTYVWGDVPMGSHGITDSISVPNPALWFVTLVKAGLAKRGVTVSGGVHAVNWLDREASPLDMTKWVEIGSVTSRPLAEIVKNTLKPSQNQYAQLLLLQVGANSKDADGSGYTESAGLREERAFLGQAGVKRGSTHLEEGSGLSRGALVTASASVQLLTYMTHHKDYAFFYNGLPIAGVDGTLRNRFKGTFAANNLHAKTGSLGGVDTLSGYVTTKGGDKLAFSTMLNNYYSSGHHADGRSEIDHLLGMVVNYTGKLP